MYRHYVRRPDQQIFSILTGGRNEIGGSTIVTYDISGARSHNIGGQDFATTRFNNGPSNIQFGLDTSDPLRPKFPVLDGTNIFDTTAYSISNVIFPHYHTTQLNFQGAASLAHSYHIGSHYGTFEVGAKIRSAHKTQNENDLIYNPNPGTNILLSQTLGGFTNRHYYDHAYQFGPMSNYTQINQLVLSNLATGFTLDSSGSHIQSDPADYDGNERVSAGYIMNNIGFGKLRLQTGVRLEATDETYNANQVNLSGGTYVSTTPIKGGGSYMSVLPSVQLQYLLTENTNIRATFGMGISRPNFADIVPSRQVDPNTSPYPQIQVGNPALRPTRGNNYDLLVEHFFHPLGVLQGGFFYKSLTNPIYATKTRTFGGTFPIYDQTQSINGPSGHITGVEMAWEQRLSFLPGLLSGFGVAANYSYTTSQVTFPTGFAAATPGGPGRNRPRRAAPSGPQYLEPGCDL